MSDEREQNDQAPLSPAADSATMRARFAGAHAAIGGVAVGDNPYHEDSWLHWEWMDGWMTARIEMRRCYSLNNILEQTQKEQND